MPSITAIDTRFDSETRSTGPGIGTGVVISPNYVLTAAHNLFIKAPIAQYFTDIRVTSSNQQKDLDSRAIRGTNLVEVGNVDLNVDPNVNPLDDPINTVPPGLFLPFVEQFLPSDANTREESQVDIGLIEVNNRALISDAPPIGLIAFVDPLTLEDSSFRFRIQTAGYPADNVANSFPSGNPNNNGIPDQNGNIRSETELDGLTSSLQVQGRDLVLAPGVLDADRNETTGRVERANEGEGERRIQYSTNIDAEQGQSGSPVWGFLPEEDGSEPIPRVFAVHSRGASAGSAANFGTLIDKEAYDLIIDEIEGDGDPDLLPENAIIGSNPRIGITPPNDGNDLINGTYRKELILGLTGNDTIFGAGADDRLEGNEGNDILEGEEGDDILTGGAGDDLIDGGKNFDFPIIDQPIIEQQGNDIAVFSANRSEYSIQTVPGGLLRDEMTIVTHLNGGIDGTDTLTNIEELQFADGKIPLPLDEDDNRDGQVNFTGGSGNDNLIGNILDNILTGNGGNDRLEGGDGNDSLSGGNGIDTLKGDDGNDTLAGGNGVDTLIGGNGIDSLYGEAGNDVLFGSNNEDRLEGGDDNDTLSGGNGVDTLKGDDGNDSLSGGNNNDRIFGGNGDDQLLGNDNNDVIYGGNGSDSIYGGSGNDTAVGGSKRDLIVGDLGNDRILGGNDSDSLFAKEGNDSLYGQNGNDSLYGHDGDDRLEGGNNQDRIGGDAGKDILKGDSGNDFLSGGDDNDTLIGGSGADVQYGENGNDVLYGGDDNDRIFGNNNNDSLYGGNGLDNLKGGSGNDFLYGGNNNDTVIGGNNSDRILGENGNDRLEGGNGSDTLTGGEGLDDFVFASINQPADVITDFTVEDDSLVFVASGFAGISTLGMVSVDMFTIGSNASTTSARFIYSAGSGELFYDQDGSGSSAKVKLADLDAGLPLTNSDFVMI